MCEHALVAVNDALYGIVICEHREDGIVFTGIREVFSCFGAQCDQRLRPFLRSVVNCDGVTGLDEVGCHPAAHMSEANEADVHVALLFAAFDSRRLGRANASQQDADCEDECAANGNFNNDVSKLSAQEAIPNEDDCQRHARQLLSVAQFVGRRKLRAGHN